MSTSRQKKNGIIWSFTESIVSQLASFVISLFIARILTPKEYGTVGVCMIFINFINIFVEAGIINALVRKLDKDDRDFSTAFWFNLIASCILYLILFVSASFIADFFETDILKWAIRILGLCIIINASGMVQNSMLLGSYKIRQICFITVISQVSAGLIALYLAFNGFGVWALIIQYLVATSVRNIGYWLVNKWHPKFIFNYKSYKYFWHFGSKMIGTRIIGSLYSELYSFIIGKHLGLSDLGYYSNANTISQKPASILNGTIQKMAVPIFSEYQNNETLLRKNFTMAVNITAYVSISLMSYLALAARPLILSIWTDKWEGAIAPFQILCFVWALDPITTLNLSLFQATNKTNYIFKLEVLKKPIGFIILFLSIHFGFIGIIWGLLVYTIIAIIINTSAARKVIGYPIHTQLIDIVKYGILNLPGLLIAHSVLTNFNSPVISLPLSFVADVIIIWLLSELFRPKAYTFITQELSHRYEKN